MGGTFNKPKETFIWRVPPSDTEDGQKLIEYKRMSVSTFNHILSRARIRPKKRRSVHNKMCS